MSHIYQTAIKISILYVYMDFVILFQWTVGYPAIFLLQVLDNIAVGHKENDIQCEKNIGM